jgi:hypothetical protein
MAKNTETTKAPDDAPWPLGTVLKFAEPMNADEEMSRYVLIEYRGPRVLVQWTPEMVKRFNWGPLVPTSSHNWSDLVPE